MIGNSVLLHFMSNYTHNESVYAKDAVFQGMDKLNISGTKSTSLYLLDILLLRSIRNIPALLDHVARNVEPCND